MKIVYTGGIYTPYISATLLRMQTLQELGHDVHPHCVIPYSTWGGRWGGALFRRYYWGPPIRRYNQDLLTMIQQERPDTLWVDKGVWLFPKTLQAAKDMGVTSISYTPDPAFTFHKNRWFRGCTPLYDVMVTTKPYEVSLYRAHGAKHVLLFSPMFDPKIHNLVQPTEEEQKTYSSSLVFIGTYTPRRDKYLRPLAENGFDLAIWGGNWQNCHDKVLRRHVRGGGLSGRDYCLGLACSKIALGLLNPLCPDTSTTRSVEIPAVKAFMLAERTEEHSHMFVEGIEAEFFNTTQELLDKAKYYLSRKTARHRIAAAGYQRVHASGYDAKAQIKKIISVLEQQKIHIDNRVAS